jgi:hypothetical protein
MFEYPSRRIRAFFRRKKVEQEPLRIYGVLYIRVQHARAFPPAVLLWH